MVMPGDNVEPGDQVDYPSGHGKGLALRDSRRRPHRGCRHDRGNYSVKPCGWLCGAGTPARLHAAAKSSGRQCLLHTKCEFEKVEQSQRLGAVEMPREIVTLQCGDCKERNYSTTKNRKTTTERLEFKKFCRRCRKHTPHKEVK